MVSENLPFFLPVNKSSVKLKEIFQQLFSDIQETGLIEAIAVVAGIVSVWFSKKENVLVYPVGLINTGIYVYISLKGSLPGEAAVNLYYTIMSFYGWYMWMRKDQMNRKVLHITASSSKEWLLQILFFLSFYIVIYFSLAELKKGFFPGAIPWADALASAAAFTGMWLMTRKKVESWYWWIITNIASVPLYFVKHYVLTSVYYLILLFMAVAGLIAWQKKLRNG
jgi:nicotinamide mononucleotide transporter